MKKDSFMSRIQTMEPGNTYSNKKSKHSKELVKQYKDPIESLLPKL